MAYVIGTYNKYWKEDRECAVYVFKVNDVEYAIKKVKNKWNIPQAIDDNSSANSYYIYNDYEDALAFAHTMKSLN